MAITIPVRQLGSELKRVRRERDMSLRDVEEATGISASTLSRVERGHVPDVETIRKIADFAGVRVQTGGKFTTDSIETDEDMVKAIEVHLRANKNLDEEVARAIARSYEVVMQVELARREKKDG